MVRRKDTKGRVLHDGETQRTDGRYAYQYTDASGKRKVVYSWKLIPSDRTPPGKRKDLSLREKETKINEDLSRGVVPCGGNLTVLEIVEKYVSQKKGVRYNTQESYKAVINFIKKEEFGEKRIDAIKLSDAKAWLIKLQADGRRCGYIHCICGVVRPAFQMAVDDDLILKNPFDFQLATVIVNDRVTREAFTEEQERAFLEFVAQDAVFCKYYDGIYILFKTGLRISEFVGLTLNDIDMPNRKINIDHQLQRKKNMEYMVEKTKTTSGIRQIPMSDDVYECFQRIIAKRKKLKKEPMIGGKCGFLFLTRFGMPTVAQHWESYFKCIREKYNSIHKVQLPIITPHVCRHTFCTNMAKSGMNPKTLQYIMGHSDIGITLNTYAHAKYEDAKKEMKEVFETKAKQKSAM